MNRVALLALLVFGCMAISRYNFNVCRITYCQTQEQSCVQGVGTCMQNFALTRQCLSGCNTDNQTYNNCWKSCKQTTNDNTYQSIVSCYEQMCYIYGGRLMVLLVGVVLALALQL